MKNVTVTFTQRDFSGPVYVDGITWSAERLEWGAIGGPISGRLRAEASGAPGDALTRLWSLVDLLRCGVEVGDELGPGWWGYASVLEIHSGGGTVRVSLEEMANDVFASFRAFSPNASGGVKTNTSSVRDYDSIAIYGTKQRAFTLGQISYDDALAYATTRLKDIGKPVVSTRVQAATSAQPKQPYAILYLRGWWDTLDWKFYSDGRGQLANLNGGSQQKVGEQASNTRIAQQVVVGDTGWTCSEVWIRGAKFLAADNLKVDIMTTSAGRPGVSMGSATLAPQFIQDEMGWLRFVFSAPIALTANTAVYLQVSRTGANSIANYFIAGVDQGLSYTVAPEYLGWLLIWNGSAWVNRFPDADLTFVMIGIEETTLQLARVLDATSGAGQFLAGSRVEAASGVLGRMYHDGSLRGKVEAETFLKVGTSAGQRLLARIERDRTARVYLQPAASSAQAVLSKSGQLVRGDGHALALSEAPAGEWVRLAEMAAPGGMLGYNGAAFVESCYWDGQGLKVGNQ